MVSQGDGTRPTISTVDDGSGQIIHTYTYPNGTRSYAFDPPPRLVPWDERPRQRRGLAPQWSTDRSLQDIECSQRGRGQVRVLYHSHSEDADQKRRVFFLYTACLGVFPFISLLALCGGFNAALSWTTHGEVSRFSKLQTNFLMVEAIMGMIGFVSLVIFGMLKIHIG